MKRILMLVLIGSLAACQSQQPPAERKAFKTIMLRSAGQVETSPDMASFRVGITCIDKNLKKAKECLVLRSNAVMETLKGFSIAEEDIKTTGVSLDKSFSWRRYSSVFEGYDASMGIIVSVRDLDQLEAVITELIDDQKVNLGRLSYSHSRLDSLENLAYQVALENADNSAEAVLSMLPESGKEVLKVGNVSISSSKPGYDYFEEDMDVMMIRSVNDRGNINMSSGLIRVDALLYVEYRIQ